ncbi:acyl-CoA dehydrogenase [Frankia sp. Cr1]|uniref:acyl-CoA dehydrogenase n=1 Tax=Frankia sp. Cr1 TaxID=3073931 RepID=UPI002AD1EA50|nr:acyl-CoA dehydrogenase [Frankia sp. Cr1]
MITSLPIAASLDIPLAMPVDVPCDVPLDVPGRPIGTATGRTPMGRPYPPARVGGAFAALIASGRLDLPLPAAGATAARWRALADLAAFDVTLARLAQAHTSAAAILIDSAGPAPEHDHRWGLWATEEPIGSLVARRGRGGWTIHGVRSSCPGARVLTHALVAARVITDGGEETREGTIGLFAVRLNERNVAVATAGSDGSASQAMTGADTATVLFDGAPAIPVGESGWSTESTGSTGGSDPDAAYLDQPIFWHTRVDIAACWFGGATGVARTLFAAGHTDHEGEAGHLAGRTDRTDRTGRTGRTDRRLDIHALEHLGRVDAVLMAMRCVLETAARDMDADPDDVGGSARRRALRVRANIEAGATEVLDRVGRALGPGPLCADRGYARRVADLSAYLRQNRVERDLTDLAAVVLADLDPLWW